MTSFFATGSAGKFFGFGAGGVLSTYTVYTRSEKMRASRRPGEDRRGRRAVAKRERKNGKLSTLAAAAASTAPAPADAPASPPKELPSASVPSPPPTPPDSVSAPRVDAEGVDSPPDPAETPVRATAPPASSRRDRRASRARAPRDTSRHAKNPVSNAAHLVACVAAPLALRAARDFFRARRRADDAHPAPDRAETPADARELLRRLRADGAHPSTAHAAAHIDRLLRERETLLRRLSAARARPSSPSTPLSLRTRAAVRLSACARSPPKTKQTNKRRTRGRRRGRRAREEARSLAELDRVVGFQAKELRYLRVTLAEKERALAAATGRARRTETDATKPEDDDASRASSDDEHASECDRSVSVDLSVDESASTADGLDAGFATTSPVRVFLRVASTSRATSRATSRPTSRATSPASSSGSSGRGSRVSQDSESQVADSESVWTPEMRTIRGAASEAADALLRTPASELLEIGAASKITGRGRGAGSGSPGTPEETPATPRVASRRSSPEYDEVDAQRMQRARSRVTRISPTRAVAGRRPL